MNLIARLPCRLPSRLVNQKWCVKEKCTCFPLSTIHPRTINHFGETIWYTAGFTDYVQRTWCSNMCKKSTPSRQRLMYRIIFNLDFYTLSTTLLWSKRQKDKWLFNFFCHWLLSLCCFGFGALDSNCYYYVTTLPLCFLATKHNHTAIVLCAMKPHFVAFFQIDDIIHNPLSV